METTLYMAVALASISSPAFAQQTQSSNEKPIEMTPIPGLSEEIKRELILIPFVTIDGHTLRFYDNFTSDITITIAHDNSNADNPTIVYSGTKTPKETQHELPEWFTGEYLIYITIGNTLYYGEITIK